MVIQKLDKLISGSLLALFMNQRLPKLLRYVIKEDTYMDNIEAAKKIFMDFNGSHYLMAREEMYDIYKSYGIPKYIEWQWAMEKKQSYLSDLAAESNPKNKVMILGCLLDLLACSKDSDGLIQLAIYARDNFSSFDSFSNIMINEMLINAVGPLEYDIRKRIIEQALTALAKMIAQPLVISESYKVNGEFPEYITPEKLHERVSRKIAYWKNEMSKWPASG